MGVLGNFDPNTNKPFHLFLLAIGCGGIWLTQGMLSLLAVPLFGWVLSRWVVEGVAFIAKKGGDDAVREWNGRYFAFNEYQVRIFWDKQRVWVKAADVFRVLGESPDSISRRKIAVRLGPDGFGTPARKEGECFTDQGVISYLNARGDLTSVQFRRWFEREVFAILHKQREVQAARFEQHTLR